MPAVIQSTVSIAATAQQEQSLKDVLGVIYDELANIRAMLGASSGGAGAGALVGSEVFVIPSIANTAGTGSLSTGATVAGAAVGDLVLMSSSVALGGLTAIGFVSAANTVKTMFTNNSGGTINLGSSTLRYLVIPQAAVAKALAAMTLTK